ncbi:ABC transporter permease [Acidisoma cellulosilytica]|uniref:ABC transporter permease n=1 Tax=Acidisoma cellulosilyticum TaxID=2802395 RepID=A0A963Z3J0_9PROT|nr:ABC transporter permease [Acidisoma cellulosilyticum]MCB8882160.1 ABC transporter permease [Acidisoma cellulosilyticum]
MTVRTWLRRTDWPTVFAAVLVILVMAIVILGPFLAPQSPTDSVDDVFALPAPGELLGSDVLGRDVLSRVLSGGWRFLTMAGAATILGVGFGSLIGILAALIGGILDEIIMRLADVVLAFPQLILALLFVSFAGSSLSLVVLVIAIVHVPQVARTLRAASLRVVGEDYVRYSESIGLPRRRIVWLDILPNVRTTLFVELGLRLTFSIALIASLSYLSFGAQPPSADWGLMIHENQIGIESNPWPVIAPVVLIALLSIGINVLSDRLSRRRGKRGRLQTAAHLAPVPAKLGETA